MVRLSPRLALISCLLLFSTLSANALEATPKDNAGIVEAPLKEILSISENGLSPQTIRLDKLDGSVFFLNNTSDSLVIVEIDYTGKRFHCASPNLEFHDDEMLRSVEPIGPRDFAISCFPDKGTYPFLVRGVKAFPNGLKGKIVVK